jgi:molecular chaperone DnaJ
MPEEDLYDLLGIDRGADAGTIKSAYRKLAMKYHPDRNPDDAAAEKKFKDINAAYEILKDEQKRAAYDRFGHAAFENGGPGGGGFGGGGFEGGFASGFADIFDEMFGDFGGRRRGPGAGPARGADLRFDMEVTLEQAFKGDKTAIRVPSSEACTACKGTGAAGAKPPETCDTCGGHGRVRAQSGFFTVERICFFCGGQGQTIKDPCRTCGGTGRTTKEKTLNVTIPAGVEDGMRIRLSGEGQAGLRGAPPGDLYLFISVAPHRIFQRDGANIYCRVPIPMTTAALGGTIEVPTVDGARARINIPTGTQTGNRFRLKDKGMSVLRSDQRGDMFVEAFVETPVNLTKKQKDLLKDFAGGTEGKHEKHSPESHGFFAKAKELWDDLTD